MDATKCVSNAIWIDYSKGLLDAKTLEQVIAHAAQCEICADIKEGIDAMEVPNNLETKVASLDQKIEDRFKAKQAKVIPLMPWFVAIAAILIAVVGLVYVSNEINKTPQTIVLKTDTIYLDTSSIKSVPAIAMEVPKPTKKTIVKPYTPAPPAINSMDDAEGINEIAASKEIEAEALPTLSESPKALTEDVAAENIELKQVESKSTKRASTRVAQVVFNAPSDSVKMVHAYSMFNANAYEPAIQILSQILSDKNSPNYYEALYLSAVCNVRLNKIAEAKKQFKNIPKGLIPYGLKADSVLKTIP